MNLKTKKKIYQKNYFKDSDVSPIYTHKYNYVCKLAKYQMVFYSVWNLLGYTTIKS